MLVQQSISSALGLQISQPLLLQYECRLPRLLPPLKDMWRWHNTRHIYRASIHPNKTCFLGNLWQVSQIFIDLFKIQRIIVALARTRHQIAENARTWLIESLELDLWTHRVQYLPVSQRSHAAVMGARLLYVRQLYFRFWLHILLEFCRNKLARQHRPLIDMHVMEVGDIIAPADTGIIRS